MSIIRTLITTCFILCAATTPALAEKIKAEAAKPTPLEGEEVTSLEEAKKPVELGPRKGFLFDELSALPVQDRGRVKPLETFAEESVMFITGKRSWKGMSAMEVIFGWLIAYDREWEDQPFIRVAHAPLKTALGLDPNRQFFSPQELQENTKFRDLLRQAMQKEQRKERLDDREKKLVQLQNQRGLLEAIVMGQSWNVLPNPQGTQQPWVSLASLTDRTAGTVYPQEKLNELAVEVRNMLDTFLVRNAAGWGQATRRFVTILRDEMAPKSPALQASLQRELGYNHLRPFRLAWIFYSLGFVLMLAFLTSGKNALSYAGLGSLVAAFALHGYGFVLRCLIAGRPPVTNMYESVIWVTWGCMFFSFLVWAVYRNAMVPTAASVFSIVGLVLADNLPLVLDPSIQPLEPVLRSNFWLTIHVLTITLSYAAFALSLCLGNVVLGHYLFSPQKVEKIKQASLYMYRAMQIGVVLLAAGTILGGVWADYSWGRFWGWDPKEVWALIALLLYLAVLHGRFTGWLRGFGFVATTVVSFLGVLMAWYGVNFVLGVGLHSYGFGTGGAGYVVAYIAAQVAFIIAAYIHYVKVKTKYKLDGAVFPRTK